MAVGWEPVASSLFGLRLWHTWFDRPLGFAGKAQIVAASM